MKGLFAIMGVLGLGLVSCAPVATAAPTVASTLEPTAAQTPPLDPTYTQSAPTITATSMVISITPTDFTEPDPTTWVLLMKPVREYFYYRKIAVVNDNVQILWDHYPELKQGTDQTNEVNVESNMVDMYQGLKPFDGNIFPEYYDKIKVIMGNGTAEVLVHGMELFIYKNDTGQFDDSGGEFKIILVLSSLDNQNWTVVKTIDITGP